MKCPGGVKPARAYRSRPIRGAWIEMPSLSVCGVPASSRPIRGAWIEMGR